MAEIGTFQEFFATQSVEVNILGFILNLVLAAGLALVLRHLYIIYGTSLSNRLKFASNFILLTVTTMIIITVVKSSLALSLGLVGALSIVRFRAAIKEPEELAYLFIAISIGLGLGANQRVITLVGFVALCILIWINHFFHKKKEHHNLHLTVLANTPKKELLKNIVKVLKENCLSADLKRVDETANTLEASFLVEFTSFNQLNQTREKLHNLSKSIEIRFLDNKGL